MLKLFRSIRKSLLFQDKTRRYFQYALGEIVLVVIGILIALQINNWNESKKIESKARAVMLEILYDLQYSIQISNNAIGVYEKKDSLLTNVLENEVTKEDYLTNREYRLLFNRGFNMAVTSDGFDKLTAMSDDLSGKYDNLITILKRHYGYTSSIMLDEYKATRELSREILERYALQYSWYSTHFNQPDEAYLNYCLNDPIYKNEIHLFRTASVSGYLYRIYLYRFSAIRNYLELHEELQTGELIPDHISYLQAPETLVIDSVSGRYRKGDQTAIIDYEEDSGQLAFYTDSGYYWLMSLTGQKLAFEDHSGRTLVFDSNEKNEITHLTIEKNGRFVERWVKE